MIDGVHEAGGPDGVRTSPRLAAGAWGPVGAPAGRELSASLVFADAPDEVWPIDWELSGFALRSWRWSVKVYGDVTGRGPGPHQVVLTLPFGRFSGTALVVSEPADLPPFAAHTELDGHGPLERQPW